MTKSEKPTRQGLNISREALEQAMSAFRLNAQQLEAALHGHRKKPLGDSKREHSTPGTFTVLGGFSAPQSPEADGIPVEQNGPDDRETTDAPKDTVYADRVVAFVDILGFKEIVQRSGSDPALVRRIHNALDLRHDNFAKHYAAEVELDRKPEDFDDLFHTFSDCIVISVRPTIEEVGLLVFMAFRICRQLLANGFLSRGGVARGKLFHRVDKPWRRQEEQDFTPTVPMVFGPAFVEAYQFENAHADGPRIILQNSVWKLINEHCDQVPHTKLSGFLRDHVRRAADGPAFIDIFADFQSSGRFYNARRDLDTEIGAIRSHICDALDMAADKPHHFRKNAQLAKNFNRAVIGSERHEHQIPASKLPSEG